MLTKIIKHLRKGDLMQAISYKLDMKRWRKFVRDKEYIDYIFDNDIYLKLYTDSMLSRILYQKKFEEEELTFYRCFLKPGNVVLDIGANIGLHVLFAAKLISDNGHVFAFEPVSKTYQRLRENVVANRFKNITTVNAAMSDTVGRQEMTISLEGFDAWNSLGGKSGQTGHKFSTETIQTISLDKFTSDDLKGLKVDFIKIDTEGWEANVLDGGINFLTRESPVLMIEYADDICKNFGRSTTEIYDRLTAMGYYLLKFDHKNRTFRRISRDERFGVANIIATKDPEFSI